MSKNESTQKKFSVNRDPDHPDPVLVGEKFITFEAAGEAWAFPRSHWIGFNLQKPYLELSFTIQSMLIKDPNAPAVLNDILAGKISTLLLQPLPGSSLNSPPKDHTGDITVNTISYEKKLEPRPVQ